MWPNSFVLTFSLGSFKKENTSVLPPEILMESVSVAWALLPLILQLTKLHSSQSTNLVNF